MSKTGRNDRCICGSGKKFKDCCWGVVGEQELAQRQAIASLKPIEGKEFEALVRSLVHGIPPVAIGQAAAAGYAIVDWCHKLKMKGPQPAKMFNPEKPDAGELLDVFRGSEADRMVAGLFLACMNIQKRFNDAAILQQLSRQAPGVVPPVKNPADALQNHD